MDSRKPFFKSIPFWILVLILLYSALGFFAIPYFIKKQSTKFIDSSLNSTLEVENISFNPFTFSSSLTKISLTDKDSSIHWFSADEISLNANLWSTLFKNLSLKHITINNPYYKFVTENKNNSVSVKYPRITRLENKQEVEDEFLIDIGDISIIKGSIDFNDKTGKKQINLNLKELNFNNQLFSTLDKESQFDLSFKTQDNEKAQLSGQFNFAQLKIDAKWQLQQWKTQKLFEVIGDEENKINGLLNKSGQIDANGQLLYHVNQNQSDNIKVNQLSLTDFNNIYNKDKVLNLSQVALTNAQISLVNQAVVLEKVETDGANIDLAFDEENNFTWEALNTEPKAETKDNTQNHWSYDLSELTIGNSSIVLNKVLANSILKNNLELNQFVVKNISSNSNQSMQLDAQIILDATGQINLKSTIKTSPLDIQGIITGNTIDLSLLNAWIPAHINPSISKGDFSFEQKLSIIDSIQSTGNMVVEKLELLDKDNSVFLSLNELNLEQFSLDSKTKNIEINNIKLDQAQGTLLMSADKQLNLSDLIEDNNKATKKNQTDKSDWTLEIKQVELIDAKTSFIDKSVKPHYHTELAKLNGNIKGLSSSNLSKAQVKLNGVIDSYGKISVNGKINPLSEKAYTDLTIGIQNLDLQNFSSYASKYLAFPINRGKADFDLKYKLNQSLLKGVNNLTFNQLKFGDKNPSKDAVDLPLKLAVSLLTDGKGVMKINMPVSGNIDDPEFSYGGLVFKAFFKLITGIVASPFKLLGKLVPGGADLDLSGVQFIAGTSQLKEGEEQKLKAMQQILSKKSDLLLELISITHTENDGKILSLNKLLKHLNLTEKPDFSDESFFIKLQNLYQNNPSLIEWQSIIANSTTDGVLNKTTANEKIWNALVKAENVESDLNQLSKQRGLYIQSELIEKHAIEKSKIFLKPSQNTKELPPQIKFGIAQ